MTLFKEKHLQVIFLLCCLVWLIFNFMTANISGVFSDEFIYFHIGHLHAKLADFIFYDPGLFFGHSPLVSFIHWILSPFGMFGIRLFHVVGLWLVLIAFRPKSFWQYFCCLFVVLHPTFLTHSTFLYPEIIQALLGIVFWQLYCSERFKLCAVFFLVAVLWRESSLAFFFALIPFLISQKSFKAIIPFIPGLITLGLHLGYVALTNSWNPGRVEASTNLMSLRESFLHLNQSASFILGIGLFYPLILWPIFILLKRSDKLKAILNSKVELIFLTIFLITFLFVIIYKPLGDSWLFFHRLRSLGILGFVLILGLGYFSSPTKWSQSLIFGLGVALSFYTFFLFYRDLSTRDLIPAALILLYSLSRLRPNKTLVILMILSFNLSLSFNYAGVVSKDFLKGSSAGLNDLQRQFYLFHFNETLKSNLGTKIKLDRAVSTIASDGFFVAFPLQNDESSTKFLSFDHEQSFNILEENVAFTLYLIK